MVAIKDIRKKVMINIGIEIFLFFGIILYSRRIDFENFNYEIFLAMYMIFNFMLLISEFFKGNDSLLPSGLTVQGRYWSRFLDNSKNADHEEEVKDFWGRSLDIKAKKSNTTLYALGMVIGLNLMFYVLYLVLFFQ